MLILVINSGSSSLKFQLIKTGKEFNTLAKGHIDGIGLKSCKFTFSGADKNIGQKFEVKDHREALNLTFQTLTKAGIIKKYSEIDAIGHRVVHGGEKYTSSVKIDAKVIKEIDKLSELAPLHNPPNLKGILACKKLTPKTPQIAVFDTAFHQSMPEKAYLYGLPYDYYERLNIRRYGFHGTSHKYVIQEALRLLKKKNAKIISCHLGNGSSITAFDQKSIDTSMGFTPLEGIMMGTRSGTIDPAIVFYLQEKLKISTDEIDEILNKKSGLKGVSEISSDMRKIYEESKKKNRLAKLTIELLSYQIAKYCGAYIAALNGLEALIFTGGMGIKADYIRKNVCKYLEFLGLKLDDKKNQAHQIQISDPKSKVKVFVIETNEELQIAKETAAILKH